MFEIFESIFYYIGKCGPILLLCISLFLLWNKHNLFFYYSIGIIANTILNIILKCIVQQPRPFEDPKLFHLVLKNMKQFIFKDYTPFDIFGMPSGHTQSAFFSTVFIFLALKKLNILCFYLIISIIIMIHRIIYRYHSLSQVLIGDIVGGIVACGFFYLAQQKIKGKIKEKPDDFGPI